MWRVTPLPSEATDGALQDAMRASDVRPLFTHTSYLINLGSLDEALWERSIASLAVELERGQAVGASGVVTHVGTDSFEDVQRARERICAAIADARARSGATVPLLLENSAGAGRQYGADLRDLGALLCAAEEREAGPLGICLDSCHAFAQGYDVRTHSGWIGALDELGDACGRDAVDLVHANDCKFGRGEKRDRHEWIGEGEIGPEGFRAMLGLERLARAPVVLEMPGEPPEKDRVNLERLREMRET
jgi:deoxyribonuclease-4